MSKICWKHFKISDFEQDFDPLSNIDEIANSVGLGVLKKPTDQKNYGNNMDYEPEFKKEKLY